MVRRVGGVVLDAVSDGIGFDPSSLTIPSAVTVRTMA
jgi:hypothetical protein